MKAIALQTDLSRPALRAIDVPPPVRTGEREALVQVLAVGLDGTDKELVRHRATVECVGRGDLILGHELLGRVTDVGPSCALKVGELVTALVRRPCGETDCIHCRSGRQDYCSTGRFTERGIRGADGFLTEYLIEDVRYLVPVPDDLGELGVLIEPQSVIEKALDSVGHAQGRLGSWTPRSVLVLGAGPLGVLTALTCRSLGYDVDVCSLEPPDGYAPSLLRDAGCAYRRGGGEPPGADGKSWDLVFECTGHSPLAFGSIGALARNGVLVILGVAAETGDVPAPTDAWMRSLMANNLTVIGSVNASRGDFEAAIGRLQTVRRRFPTALERVLTDRIELDQVPDLDFGRIALKAVVRVHRFTR